MKQKIIFALLVALVIPAIIFAQEPEERLTLDDLVTWTNALYAALVTVWGFLVKPLGKYLPGIDKMQTVFKVAAGAIVLAGAFVVFGWGEVLQYLFVFLGTMGFYDLFIKPTKDAILGK